MSLTEDQKTAYEKVKEFLAGEAKVFILKGYVNTGKSDLVKMIAEYLTTNGKSFHLIAPGGKPLRKLFQTTGLEAVNLYSLIYSLKTDVTPEPDFETLSLYDIKSSLATKNNIFIVFESSLIGDENIHDPFVKYGSGKTLRDLITFAGLHSDITSNKFIFVGDPAQLPPPNSTDIYPLSVEYFREHFNINPVSFQLKEFIPDTQENAILENARIINNQIDSGNLDTFNIVPGKNVQIYDSLSASMIAGILKNSNAVVMVRSNLIADSFNYEIRKHYHEPFLPDESLQVKEILYVVKNNPLYHLSHGDTLIIDSIIGLKEKFTIEIEGKTVTLSFRNVSIKTRKSDNSITLMDVKILENLLNISGTELSLEEVKALYQLSKSKLDAKYPSPILKLSDNNTYLKELKIFNQELANSPYLNALQVKYGYALTNYDARGGEWKNVFLDLLGQINLNDKFFFQWAYSVIIKATQMLYCIIPSGNGDLKKKDINTAELNDFDHVKPSFNTTPEKPLVIYTDGSDIKGTGKLGYGIWFEYEGKEYQISDIADAAAFKKEYNIHNDVSNPTMEILALVKCLEEFKDQPVHLVIKSDYQGVQKWVNSQWKITKPYIKDLVDQAKKLIKNIKAHKGSVTLEWVKGHQENIANANKLDKKGNDKADALAKNRSRINTIKFPEKTAQPEPVNAGNDSKNKLPEPAAFALYNIKLLASARKIIVDSVRISENSLLISLNSNNQIFPITVNINENSTLNVTSTNSITDCNIMSLVSDLNNINANNPILPVKFDFPEDYLQNFYNSIDILLKEKAINILKIQHFNHLEQYTFAKDGETVSLNFYFNKKGIMTKTFHPGKKGESLKLADEVMKILQ